MASIANMSLEELKKLIEATIDERLNLLLGRFEIVETELFDEHDTDTRTWEDVKEDVKRHRWTAPAGAKSSLELLREDRDS